MPEANRAWWQEKLRANVARDRRHDRELTSAGWEIIRIWEHEDPINAADVVEGAVLSRRSGG